MASQRSTAWARLLVARSPHFFSCAPSDFFPSRPKSVMVPRDGPCRDPSADQNRPEHHLVAAGFYLEAHHAATVLLGQRISAARQPLVKAIRGNIGYVLAQRLLGGDVLLVHPALVGGRVLASEFRGQR